MILGAQGISGYLAEGQAWVEPDGPPAAFDEQTAGPATLALGSRELDGDRDIVLAWRGNRARLRGLEFGPVPEPLSLRILRLDGETRWHRELTVAPLVLPSGERSAVIEEGRDMVRQLRENLLGAGLPATGVPVVPSEAEARELLYLPEHRPPVGAVKLGLDGTIWLGLQDAGAGQSWLAMDEEEGILFRVTLPEGTRFGQGTRDAIWYAERDDLGVTWVVRAEVVAAGGS